MSSQVGVSAWGGCPPRDTESQTGVKTSFAGGNYLNEIEVGSLCTDFHFRKSQICFHLRKLVGET